MIAENNSLLKLAPIDDGQTWYSGHAHSKNRAIFFGLVIISSLVTSGLGLSFSELEYQMLSFMMSIAVLISFLFWDINIRESSVVWYPETNKSSVLKSLLLEKDEAITLQRICILVLAVLNLLGVFIEVSKFIVEAI
jgi:hypothetical protein